MHLHLDTCDYRTATQNMACMGVCACNHMPLMAKPALSF